VVHLEDTIYRSVVTSMLDIIDIHKANSRSLPLNDQMIDIFQIVLSLAPERLFFKFLEGLQYKLASSMESPVYIRLYTILVEYPEISRIILLNYPQTIHICISFISNSRLEDQFSNISYVRPIIH
jgi:hypothetical protein